jgi:hypothetical protein
VSGEAFFQPSALSRLFRPTCSECGAGGLRWVHLVDLMTLVKPDQRERVHEVLHQIHPDSDAWICSECGGFGAFSADFALS